MVWRHSFSRFTLVDVQRFARAEDGDDDGQADRGFRRGDDHHEENEDLSAKLMPVRREGDEGSGSRALSISSIDMKMVMMLRLMRNPQHAAGEQDGAQHEIVGKWDHLVLHLLAVRRWGPWLAGQHHGAHDGDQDQDRSDFKGQQEFVEEQIGR